jgi:VanZ family protein
MIKKDFSISIFCYYLPAFLWMVLIFYLSSISGLKTGVESIGVEIFIRKIAHLFIYFVLTLLIWRILKHQWGMSLNKSIVASFFFVLLYAVSDEVHQYFVDDRAGRAVDVLIDSAGSMIGVGWVIFLSKINKKL